MATAEPSDKSYAKQKESAEIAKKVLARFPDHPGAHHYVIHAYDYPTIAQEALETARAYGKIAPHVAHALHMPSHIYTRLGLWQESIAMNLKSADAAWKHPVGDKISGHFPHALDYLTYAYLQRAEDGKAKEIVDQIRTLKGPFQASVGAGYSFAGVPARFALERRQWKEAAALEPRMPADYPWDDFPAMEALTHFARGIGAARSGNAAVAQQAIDRLAVLRDRAGESSPYWAKQIEIQRLSAQAWLEYQQGKKEEGLRTMREAAEMESGTEKHPVTPGEILPARELLADMLLESQQYQAAHAEYLAALDRSPNRFNSLDGAGRAAELAGDKAKATAHYENLIALAAENAERPRLGEVKKRVAKK
jgi:tetratricopeptide (TPR) repeat protein